MSLKPPPSTSYGSTSLSYPSYTYPSYTYGEYNTTTGSRPRTRKSTGRPGTARPRTGASTIARIEAQQVICAIAESRGISPTVGLAIINLDLGEAVLCQICDSQTYVKTIHKLRVHAPSEILIMSTATSPKSKLFSIIEENLEAIGSELTLLDRRYWAENTGFEYINSLVFEEDVEAINLSVARAYYTVCCFAAVIKYIDAGLNLTFPFHSLRVKYEPSEGTMMIDVSTIYSLELVQNLKNPRSRDCLFGLLNQTLTPMGARLLRSNILQPLTETETLNIRYDALEELTSKEEMFFATRSALKNFLDVDKVLTALIIIPKTPTIQTTEQSINQVIMLKQFVLSINPIYIALAGARSALLASIRDHCHPNKIVPVQTLIDEVINEDTIFARKPLELRNQRTYAVKSGVNGLLDVARTTYKEATEDAYQHSTELSEQYDVPINLKYENTRQFYFQMSAADFEDRPVPPIFTNIFRKKKMIECQTLELMKRNQKITISHQEVVLMSDHAVQALIEEVRIFISILFKTCEAIAMLDMIAAFAQLVTTIRPQLSDTLAVRAGRHPIREKIMQTKFIPNDVYASQQHRFQIITGCNMSGKSTYIRSVALLCIMAQIGSFVPATYASFPIFHQLFARVGMDDSIETNASTFAAEMREIAFILRNIDNRSLAIVDELGRGTSTRDGLAIALSIAEALVQSKALVWFATHFVDLARILAERNGVVNLHLAVQIKQNESMTMLYKIEPGTVKERHYGLALAHLLPFPDGLVERAEFVAHELERNAQKRINTSTAIIKERRRKLILSLKEHLVQAHNGAMEGEVLTAWLEELQKEFITRMTAIDAEAAQAEQEYWDDEEEHDDQALEMRTTSAISEMEVDDDRQFETIVDERSIISVSSRMTSTAASSSVDRAISEN
ncbi:DNA mismatch repair protein MutS [Dendryphion nanum]|uniref:DNA mismatch repair protein MutS n=1 Tax=Dendryphion nanum TaxID=256645 RepID=A0A9P9ITN6_9PLEO|nr:DNA mismatch repair protein MutS [Dendryphion nanum]